ncbi:MAG: hypothetical protein ACLGPM_03740 [Acidobacteriota bacterium]
MRKLAACFALFVLVTVFAVSTPAQQGPKPADSAHRAEAAQPADFYRLEFVLEELDPAGKPVNSRSFTTTADAVGRRHSSITVGSKIPITTGGDQFQYIDIGTKITASDIHEDGKDLAFNLIADVSSMDAPRVVAGASKPVLRQNVWNGDVLVPVGKPTVVFKSDSLDSKGSMQLEVTVTKMQ